MSEIKVNSIKGVAASTAALTINNTDGTCTANLTNRTNKNLVVNGACLIAQRGTSSTSNSYATVDRMSLGVGGLDEACTQAQVDVASGTTPYTSGFRKAYKITNGNQTNGAGATDFIRFEYRIEAQDIANSGWNYTDSNSKISLQFWVKSSVAQNFYFIVNSEDGSARSFPMETGSLSANTWTKVTKTISGDSNLTFNNDTGTGLIIFFYLYLGTNYANNSVAVDTWKSVGNPQTPVNTTTWFTTNDATFELTGVQLEVGSVATDFEHRSFAQELQLCRRYFQIIGASSGEAQHSTNIQGSLQATPFMRANPSIAIIDNSNNVGLAGTGSNSVTSVGTIYTESEFSGMGGWVEMGGSGFTQHRFYHIYGGKFSFSSEL